MLESEIMILVIFNLPKCFGRPKKNKPRHCCQGLKLTANPPGMTINLMQRKRIRFRPKYDLTHISAADSYISGGCYCFIISALALSVTSSPRVPVIAPPTPKSERLTVPLTLKPATTLLLSFPVVIVPL